MTTFIRPVAHHLELVLFPAEGRLLEHDFMDRLASRPPLAISASSFPVVGDGRFPSPQGEGGADNDRKADSEVTANASSIDRAKPLLGTLSPIFSIASRKSCRSSALWMTGSDAPIISTPYFFEDAASATETAVLDPSAPRSVGSSAVGPLLGDDLLHRLRCDRLHIGPVRRFGVGHIGRRIRVDEITSYPFPLEGLAGLGPGCRIACLLMNDRPGAADQNLP